MSAKETFEVVDAAFDILADLMKKLGAWNPGDGFGWHFPRYRAFARALFDRSPIKVGARVRLTRTPDITVEKRWGWMGAKHFLVEGALAAVDEVDFSDGKFSAGLCFDDESWIPKCGPDASKPQPVIQRAQYWFVEDVFEVVTEVSS